MSHAEIDLNDDPLGPEIGARKAGRATGVHLREGELVPNASPGAAMGPEHVEVPTEYDAILLSSFGGPEAQSHVIPFLRNVTGGRGIPEERLEEVAVHYRHFGGTSPINEHNRQLQRALQSALDEAGLDLPVYWGNRNWAPYIYEAVAEAHANGHDRLLAIATSAYSAYSSDRQYREDWADALEATGLADVMTIDKVRQFFDHPGFVAPFFEGTRAAVREFLDAGIALEEIELLFATHSIPMDDAGRSGPPERAEEFGPEGAYAAQHKAVASYISAEVARALGVEAISWQLVYQSRSGPPSQPWLEPDINDVIEELGEEGRIKAVAIVPIGFVSDHMEVMWDLDNEAMESCQEAGIRGIRVQTPGVHDAFVTGLVDLIRERLEGRPVSERAAVTPLGPWYDVARAGDSENPRLGFRPAIAGLQP